MTLAARLDVLRLRNFRYLFIGETVSMIGDGFMPVALTFAVLDLTHSGTAIGVVWAAYSVPLVLFTLAGGVWADRLQREWVMIVSDLVRFVTLCVTAALLFSGHAQVWSLAVLGFVYGSGDAFFFPAYTALVQQIVPEERYQEANALRGVSDGFAWFIGPSISGIMVALIGAAGTLAIDAGTFLVSAAFLLAMHVPAIERTKARMSFLTELRDGWREVRSRRWLWVMMLRAMLVLFVTIAPLQVLGPLAITAQGHGASLWGLLVGLFSLGMLLGGVLALVYRPKRPMIVVTLCGTTASAPMIALAVQLSAVGLSAVWFLRGIAIGLLVAVWDTALQREIPNEAMARVSGWDWMTANGLWPLGLVLAGPIAEAMGVTAALWLSGVAGIVAGLWVLFVKDVWRLRGRGASASVSPAEMLALQALPSFPRTLARVASRVSRRLRTTPHRNWEEAMITVSCKDLGLSTCDFVAERDSARHAKGELWEHIREEHPDMTRDITPERHSEIDALMDHAIAARVSA